MQREQLRTWVTHEAPTARGLLTQAEGRMGHRHASKHIELSSGELFAAKLRETMTAMLFVSFLGLADGACWQTLGGDS